MIGMVSLLAGLVVFTFGYFLPSLIFLFLSMFIFITKYGIEIDLQNKTYLEYLLLFGYKKGVLNSFQTIESIYITGGNKTTKMHLRGHASYLTKKEYNAYIKFSEDEKIHLMDSEKKAEVEKLLKQMSKDLSVDCFDYSKEV